MKYLTLLLCFICLPLQARVITACGHPDYPPVSWVQDQQLIGVAPQVAKQIFSELGYQLKLDNSGNWKRCLQEVKAGNIDLVVAAYKTAPRTAYLNYSSVYLIADTLAIYINSSDQRRYQKLSDLKNKTVGLLLGDSFGDEFDHFLQSLPAREYVSNGAQNFAKLAYQRIDFMPLGVISGQLQQQKLGYKEQLKITSLTIGVEYYYIALGRNSHLNRHMGYINQRLAQLQSNGGIDQLQQCFGHLYIGSSRSGDCDVQP